MTITNAVIGTFRVPTTGKLFSYKPATDELMVSMGYEHEMHELTGLSHYFCCVRRDRVKVVTSAEHDQINAVSWNIDEHQRFADRQQYVPAIKELA